MKKKKTTVIICFLAGGLGNQMFQYAVARRLNLEIPNSKLVMDSSYFRKYKLRNVELNKLKLTEGASFVDGVKGGLWLRLHWNRLVHRFEYKMTRKKENGMKHFSDSLFQRHARKGIIICQDAYYHPLPIQELSQRKVIVVSGYFQSSAYMGEYRETIRQELMPKDELISKKAKEMLCLFEDGTVSVSFRCSDIRQYGLFLEDMEPGYYTTMPQRIAKVASNKKCAMFTEDPNFAKTFFPRFDSYIPCYTTTAIDQLFLMSHCRTFFLSNSTFSWWGAFLSPDPNKKIFAPKYWFKGAELSKLSLFEPAMICE